MSNLYISTMNIIFRLKIKYYNGPFICKTSLLKKLTLTSCGMDIFSELKVRLLKKGASFKEVEVEHTGRKHGVSKAYTLKNIYFVISNNTGYPFLIYRNACGFPIELDEICGKKFQWLIFFN